jgi:hypothetical protein
MASFLLDLLGSWVFIGFVVPVGIGIGIGVMSMDPPAFQIAKVCFSLNTFFLGIGVGQWLISANFSIRERILLGFIIFGIIGPLWVESLRWVHSRENSTLTSEQPAAIFAVNFITTMNIKWPGPLVYIHTTSIGKTISSVSIALYIEVVNRKPTISRIYGYRARALLEYDEGGHQSVNVLPDKRTQLVSQPIGNTVEKYRTLHSMGFINDQVYYIIDNNWTRTKHIDFTNDSFDIPAHDVQLQSGESLRGWIFFELEQDLRYPLPTIKHIELTLRNSAGETQDFKSNDEIRGETQAWGIISSGHWKILEGYYDLPQERYQLAAKMDVAQIQAGEGQWIVINPSSKAE